MTTQRMGTLDVPSTDAQGKALFYAAVGLTVMCAGLALAAAILNWPPIGVNFGIGLMVVTWIAAFERRRFITEQRRTATLREINQLERLLSDS